MHKTAMVLMTVLLLPGPALGAGKEDLPPVVREQMSGTSTGPDILPLGEDRYRIGNLLIDRRARELRLQGRFAVLDSPLEYLACAPGGKLYESLMEWDVDPYHLHLGLLLIALEPRNNLENQGDAVIAAGDPVTILVSWEHEGEKFRHRAEELIWNQHKNAPMVRTDWVFTGSLFLDGVFMAAVEKSLAAVYNDPAAVLNVPLPEGADDTSFLPRKELAPGSDTEIEVVLRAVKAETGGS
jgi:hypothetical protein